MNEIGNDEVVVALQVIIDKFGNTIESHAVVLVKQLATGFQRYWSVNKRLNVYNG